MLKNKYVVILSIFIIVSLITIISCGRKGTLNPNTAPFIEISEYRGIAKTDTTWSDSTMFEEIGSLIDNITYQYDSLFYQVIRWNAWDVDGNVVSYAYRVGTWDSLSNDWFYDRAYGIETDPETGWVLHLQPDSTMDIWTAPKKCFARATVFFPSTDTTDFRKNFGKFEVKCKDNSGAVCLKPAVKYFVTWSAVPTTYISTSQGNIDSCRVGSAILFKFIVNDNDPFGHGKEAAYYKYRLVHVARIGAREDTLGKGFDNYKFSIGAEILPGSDTTWYSTQGFEKPDEVLLSLPANDINELTQIQVKAVDKAGIEDPQYATMTFFVRDYFKPETRPFTGNDYKFLNILPDIYILGENHYLTYLESQKEIPKKIVNGKYHYATQFYYDRHRNLSALWSDDIEIYLRWEYYGEYEISSKTNARAYKGYAYHYDNNLPDNKIYCQYYCDIEYMEIQLDSTTSGLPPISTQVVSDDSGDWMRIPICKDQECKLFNISPGKHIFKVRAVDFQGAVDSTPEILEFELVEMPEEKSGILIVDDTPDESTPPNFSPEEAVDAFYENLIEGCSESVATYDIKSLEEINSLNRKIGHGKGPYFAPVDIIDCKLIIWHTNNPSKVFSDFQSEAHLNYHYDILSIYLESDGNLLFTGGPNLHDLPGSKIPFLDEYAGFSETYICKWLQHIYRTSFFSGAKAEIENYNDLHLNQTLTSKYYLSNVIQNGKFNYWDEGLPRDWILYEPISIIIDSTAEPSKELIISYLTVQSYVFQNINTTLIDSGKVIYKSKQDTASNKYKVEVYDISNNTILAERYHTNSEWQMDTLYFWVPPTCDSVQVRLWTPDIPEKNSYWDNIKLFLKYYYPAYFGTAFVEGIGGITFLDLDEATPIYSFQVSTHVPEDEVLNYEGYVGSKYTRENSGTTYILGFPLYYIKLEDARLFIHEVFDEIGINY